MIGCGIRNMDYNEVVRTVERAYKRFYNTIERECDYSISIVNEQGERKAYAHIIVGHEGTIDVCVADSTGIVDSKIIGEYWINKFRYEGFIEW